MTSAVGTYMFQPWGCSPVEGRHQIFADACACVCGALKLVDASLAPPVTFYASFAAEVGK